MINNQSLNGITYLVIIIILIFVSFNMYSIYKTPEELQRNSTYYFMTTIIPISLLFGYLLFSSLSSVEYILTYIIIGIVLVIIGIVYIILKSQLTSYITNPFVLYTLIGLIILFFLSLVYTVFSSRLNRLTGWSSIMLNTLFYIPCLISMFFQYLYNESIHTPKTTLTLFFIEILFILLYLYYNKIKQLVANKNRIQLLHRPVFINSQVFIDEELKKVYADRMEQPIVKQTNELLNQTTSYQDNSHIRTNYSISMWLYVNPMPLTKNGYSQEETNIFTYSNHPTIVYNAKDNEFVLYFSTSVRYVLELPLQKWNNIVISFRNNHVDVFVNAILKYSYAFETIDSMPKYNIEDKITIGHPDNNGLYGSICNVAYFMNPLRQSDIIYDYNTNVQQNPPIQ